MNEQFQDINYEEKLPPYVLHKVVYSTVTKPSSEKPSRKMEVFQDLKHLLMK